MSSEPHRPSATSPGVELAGIGKRFGGAAVLEQINWAIPPGTRAGLLGRSGSGKTTLLRILAGLEQPDGGSLRFPCDGRSLPRPPVGLVFQNLALWPHLTARQHVACVANAASPGGQVDHEALLDEVRLPREAWDRRPSELSGGEGQRVALARALASHPQLLLLDEPLAQLDAMLRMELLDKIGEIARRRSLTAVYVTHAWDEAAALCQRIAVLEQGRLLQEGTPDDLFWNPHSETVARLTGPLLKLPKSWLAEGKIAIDPSSANWTGLLAAPADSLLLRPQHVRILSAAGANAWRVIDCRPAHAGWMITIEHPAQHGLNLAIATNLALPPGTTLGLQIGRREVDRQPDSLDATCRS